MRTRTAGITEGLMLGFGIDVADVLVAILGSARETFKSISFKFKMTTGLSSD